MPSTADAKAGALAAARAGLSVVPPRQDGTKGPLSEPIPITCDHPACVAKRAAGSQTGWTHRQHTAATVDELEQLYAQGLTGVGLACGYAGLEMAELEARAVNDGLLGTLTQRMADAGLTEVWDRVDNGWRVRTPTGGLHWHLRTDGPLPNQKLAFRPPTPDEVEADLVERRADLPPGAVLDPGYRAPPVLLAETRGAGGFTIASPTNGAVHPQGGAWVTETGGPGTIPALTTVERDALYDVFRSLDTCPPPPAAEPIEGVRTPYNGPVTDRWMDATIAHYNQDTSWDQVLAGRFDPIGRKGDERYWRATGTWSKYNATTSAPGNKDTLCVFGSSLAGYGWDVYDGVGKATTYDRFAATVMIRTGRADTDARLEVARELREQGYGPPPSLQSGSGHVTTTGRATGSDGSGPRQHALTDLGNARRLVEQHGENLKHVPQLGVWFAWDRSRWGEDITGDVMRCAKTTAETVRLEKEPPGEDGMKRLLAHCVRSQNAARINAMVQLASTEPAVPITIDQLDRDPFSLNVRNGTIDLATGRLRPHDRGELHTKVAPVEYDPDATCPTWDRFLDEVFLGRGELIEFQQLWCGYSLTGSVAEQVLWFGYGGGANGKSTLINTFKAVMGDYAIQLDSKVILASDSDQHPTGLTDLRGARMASTIEAEQGRKFAEALVKQLTGGDPIRARRMRADFFEFLPTHKLWLAANHLPRVGGTDSGIWRRLLLVPFEASFEVKPDKDLPEKLMAEAAGILAWAVRGCVEWHRAGLKVPEVVRTSTSAYRQNEDHVGRFLADCTVLGENCRTTAGDLRRAYEAWCVEQGERAWSAKAMAPELYRRGFDRGEDRTRRAFWIGFGLLADRDEARPIDLARDPLEGL